MSSSKNVDYSKWDRMNFSDSDDSDDDDSSDSNNQDEKQGGGPGNSSNSNSDLCRVTRLDRPSRVTVAPNGQVNVEETVSASASVSPARIAAALPPSTSLPPTIVTETTGASAAAAECPSSTQDEASKETPTSTTPTARPASWTSRGGFVEASNLYWSQDRYTVVLRFQLPPAATIAVSAAGVTSRSRPAWDCRVMGLLPYEQRHAAVQSLTTDYSASLVITNNTTKTEYFRDYVAYPVHAAQGDDVDTDDIETDWSIETWPAASECGHKYLMVTLHKATPVPNMTIWWRRPFRSCPEIDLTPPASADDTPKDANSSKNAFAVAWEQAHAQFRQGRSAEPERIEVDLTDNDGDET
jgi:hypothetical protein